MTRIAAGADHAGVQLKDVLVAHLRDLGHEVIDCGTHGPDRVDYPDYGEAVARKVAGGEAELGLCVCGTGIGHRHGPPTRCPACGPPPSTT